MMVHELVLSIIHFGWLGLPFSLYALYNKYYLDEKQMQLLIVQIVLLSSFMLMGWLSLFVKLVASGYFSLLVLDLCIAEYQQFISRYQIKGVRNRKAKKYRDINGKPIFMINSYHLIKKFKLKETFIFPIFVFFWIALRIIFTKVVDFGKLTQLPDGTIFQGFLVTLDGWNCNYAEFTSITFLWLIVIVFSYLFIGQTLRCAEGDKNCNYNEVNGYKIYLLNYLIKPSLLVLLVDTCYNFISHKSCDGLLECYTFFKYGILFKLLADWGIPVNIGLFFYFKIGRFSLQTEHSGSQVSVDEGEKDLELELIKDQKF